MPRRFCRGFGRVLGLVGKRFRWGLQNLPSWEVRECSVGLVGHVGQVRRVRLIQAGDRHKRTPDQLPGHTHIECECS